MTTDNQLVGPSPSYAELLAQLKQRIREAQVRASVSVNRELVLLYWEIGREILRRQAAEGWGAKVIERLADDLRAEFPEMTGLSGRNLKYMRKFATAYPNGQIVQQLAALIPWFHNCVILDKVKHAEVREFYIRQTIKNGWSRNVLVHQIESQLHLRQGQIQTNFEATLPAPQSDLAREVLKDPYIFDFLSLGKEHSEREVEKAMIERIRDTLLELGKGFAFVGSQYHLEVGDQDYYIDLLFYHLHLRRYVVIELKSGEFKPEYAGKLNFYLSAVDDMIKHEQDESTIGLILCKSKNKITVEYALRDLRKPMGVAAYRLLSELPESLQHELPDAEEIASRLKLNEERE
jgi:predicted nuclease of restriction endonuclease-like (RecB) superfamily